MKPRGERALEERVTSPMGTRYPARLTPSHLRRAMRDRRGMSRSDCRRRGGRLRMGAT